MLESSLVTLRALPDDVAASKLDTLMRQLEQQYKRSYVMRGVCGLEVKQRQLWKVLQFSSFEQWLQNACPQSRADVYAAMRTVEELTEIPRQELEEIPRMNLKVLQSLSTAVRRDPEVLKAAKVCSEREFVAKVKQSHPEQHVQSERKLTFTLPSDAADMVERELEKTMAEEECSRDQALEAWAADRILDEMEPILDVLSAEACGMDEPADPTSASHTSGT
jgi:hypothetical protein